MALSANTLTQNKIHDFPLLNRRYPNFVSQSLSLSRNLHLHKRIFVSSSSSSSSSTKVASDFDFQMKQTSSTSPAQWREFAGNVSGEWDGHGADFTSEGKPVELPENVVPNAYREWEVKVFDWQTQCPTLAKSEENTLLYKLIKLLPTVGCEADAATRHNIVERNIGGVDNQVSAFAYHSSGCYVAVWPMANNNAHKLLELEHCLVDPQNREARVRIIQIIRVDDTGMSLQNIKIFREHWYGPFRNGEQLGGCSIIDSAFASTEATKGLEVFGTWHGSSAVADFKNQDIFQELVDNKPQRSARDDHGLVLLPKQLWCSLKEIENGDTCGEVGWLLKQGHAMTSRCIFSIDGKLKEVAIGQESLQV